MNINSAITDELARAMKKIPTWPTDPLHALAVLGEEFGELTKETLQMTYEPHKSSLEAFRAEAIQTAAMAIRFVESLDRYQFIQGVQHRQDVASEEYRYFTDREIIWKMPPTGNGLMRVADDNEWDDSSCDLSNMFSGNVTEITAEEGEP